MCVCVHVRVDKVWLLCAYTDFYVCPYIFGTVQEQCHVFVRQELQGWKQQVFVAPSWRRRRQSGASLV